MMRTRDCIDRLLRATCALAALLGSAVFAHDSSYTYGRDYVSVLPGISFPSRSIGTTGRGATVSGIYGYEFTPHFLAEVNIQSSTFETGPTAGTDFYQNGATIDFVYQLHDRAMGLFTPFVLVGGGSVYDDLYPNNLDGIGAIVEAGAGIVTRPLFSNGIRFRLDGRYVLDEHQGSHAEPRVVLGIDIPLGRIEHRIN